MMHTSHCLDRMAFGDGKCECGGPCLLCAAPAVDDGLCETHAGEAADFDMREPVK